MALSTATVATLVGSIAAVCTTGAFVPQVLRVWRLKSAAEISLATFTAFAAGTFTWLLYGLLIGSLPVILANGITFVLSIVIVVLKLVYGRRGPPSVERPSDRPSLRGGEAPGCRGSERPARSDRTSSRETDRGL